MMIQYHEHVRVQRLTPANTECFFGYYDKCPWSQDCHQIIAGSTSINGRLPEFNDALKIGYIDQDEQGIFRVVGETEAWNFQQGAMAQWIHCDGVELILYNVRIGNQCAACMVDLSGQCIKELDRPVYALSPDHKWAASVDFARLQQVRPGYGYAGVQTQFSTQLAPEGDGLWLIDIETGADRLLVSYSILAQDVFPRGHNSVHWIDHIEFSPNGQWLVFLHRWLAADGGPLTRLMAVNRETGARSCLLDCGAAGHGLWLDSAHYGIWGRRGTLAAKARSNPAAQSAWMQMALRLARRMIPAAVKGRIHQESFLSLHITDGSSEDVQPQIPHGQRGGHPSLRPGGGWIVSDTLPDAKGRRTLFLASLDGNQYIPLITVAHNPATANSPFRCDLHPRWDRDGHTVCIDSMHEGFRAVYAIDISPTALKLGI